MGTVSIVFGIIGMCTSWLPVVGWLGVPLGVVGCGLGVLSATHWYAKPGYTGWGISGVVLGLLSSNLSLAYQIKHAAGALDSLHVALSPLLAVLIFTAGGLVAALGMVLARKKKHAVGLTLAYLALAGLSLSGAWALTTADRALESELSKQVESK